jgi:ATP-binding cassette subfamily C (CFTR/MRP) protein 1
MRQIPVGSTIGEGGSSLSGGQRNRVSLARALYSRTKLVLLDDVLSGLDSQTERLVFNRVLGPHGLLKTNRCTTLLATNSKRWLSCADSIIVLEHGRKTLQGRPEELAGKLGTATIARSLVGSEDAFASTKSFSADAARPISSEKAASAHLRPDSEVYKQYFKSFGAYYTAFYFALLITSVGAVQMQSVWLKWWAAAEVQSHSELTVQVLVFLAISCAAIACLALLLGYSLLGLLVRSSLHLHARQWSALMKVKYVAWITQNVGGIINRFSQDIMIIDTQLAMAFINTAMQVCTSIASTVLLIVATPYIGAVVPFLCAIFWAIQRVYLRTSKQLRTIDLEAKAPLCAHFLQSASGLTTIQAFGWSEAYREKNTQLLRESQVPYYLLASVQNWLSLVLNLVVAGLATAVVSIALNLEGLDSGYFGLALTGIMDIGFYFEVLVTSWTSLETSLGAVARMNCFIDGLPAQREGRVLPSLSWPEKGEVVIRNLTASYQQGASASPTLNNINLHIKPGQKIAICGRTGSGKSSIVSTIFGLLNITSGCVLVDDEEVSLLEPSALCSAIMLLTQDPYFIQGSIRENLLLNGTHTVSDDVIFSALEKTGLKDKLCMATGAGSSVIDRPLVPQDILTKGEMQLFAISRALLSDSKIMILDEPTSGLDHEADQIVQRVLWDHCTAGNRTMICIAHKLHSIIDFDTVVVVDAGHIVETGAPSALAKNEGSMFAQILSQSS